MIYIEKGTEPASLRAHRNTPGANFDGLDKTELRKALLKEQGYLCAYCMKKIRRDKDVKIEHYHPKNADNELDYHNLFAVCTGNEVLKNEKSRIDPERFTCDTMKKNQTLHINPQSQADMETIYYDNEGRIYSTDPAFQKDFEKQILNLNDPYGFLINNRKKALEVIIKGLKKLKPGQNAMPLLQAWEKKCRQKNESGEYLEYVGILRWYIARQIRKRT